jgi:hypothetical protein
MNYTSKTGFYTIDNNQRKDLNEDGFGLKNKNKNKNLLEEVKIK